MRSLKIKFIRSTAWAFWVTGLEIYSNLTLDGVSKLARSYTDDRQLLQDLARIRRGERPAPVRLVELFEQLIPGSAASVKSLFWDVLENPQLSGSSLDNSITQLPLELRGKIAYLDKTGKPIKRKKISSFGQIESIARFSTLDALGVLLLVAEETKSAMDYASGAAWLEHYAIYHDIAWASDFLIARLALFSPFKNFAGHFRAFIFDSILRYPERPELKEQISKMFPGGLPEYSRDFSVVTRVGRWLLHYESFNNIKFTSEQQASQFVYDRLMPLSRCSIEEFEQKADLLWDCPFACLMYDAICFGDVHAIYLLADQ